MGHFTEVEKRLIDFFGTIKFERFIWHPLQLNQLEYALI
jgi:hypothetical protein